LLLLTTAVAVVLGCWQWLRRPTIYSLPPLSEIKGMKVLHFCDFHQTKPRVEIAVEEKPEIEVAKEDWKDIYDALSPSDYDPHPATWMYLATIEIEAKNRKRYRLDLYNLFDDPIGAFSIGPTFERRTYRRGGNSAQLIRSLEKAYSKTATQTRRH
jgi:hypothetical protein